jgi:hypothetical protein
MKRHINHWVAGISVFGVVAACGAGCSSDKSGGSGRKNPASDATGGGGDGAAVGLGTNASGGDGGAPSATGMGGVGDVAPGGDCAGGPPGCVDNHNVFCEPEGFPGIDGAFAVALSCAGANCQPPNPTLTLPEPGKLCVSSAAPPGDTAGFHLSFPFDTPLDADALGITQLSFTLDAPPPGGVILDMSMRIPCECANFLPACIAFGFQVPLTGAGKHVVALTDVVQTDSKSPYPLLNTHSLEGFGFTFIADAPYDVCVSDLEFLDADGNVVTP